jgi:protein phosphatase
MSFTPKVWLTSYGCSDTGMARENNEDSYICYDIEQTCELSHETPHLVQKSGLLYIVADGMGGCNAGEVASKIATTHFIEELNSRNAKKLDQDQVHALLEDLTQNCHQIITMSSIDNPEHDGMGTTMTLAWFKDDCLHMVHIGDSRLYRLRDGQLKQISHDHSPVGEMRRMGIISDEVARLHPKRNLIDQALGGGLIDIEPHHRSCNVEPGDIFMLCSDGLSDAIPLKIIRQVLSTCNQTNLKEKCHDLINLANELDGSDNITTILIAATDKVK